MNTVLSNCPECGSDLRPGMLRCRECGTPVFNVEAIERNNVKQDSVADGVPSPEEPSAQRILCSPDDIDRYLLGAASRTTDSGDDRGFPPQSASTKNAARRALRATVSSRSGQKTMNGDGCRIQKDLPACGADVDTDHGSATESSGRVAGASNRRHTAPTAKWRVPGILGELIGAMILAVAFVMYITVPKTDPEAERQAAIWVVEHFGVVEVKTDDGIVKRYVAAEHLPEESFVITEIDLYGQEFDESELSFLPQLSQLHKLDLSKTGVGERGLKYVGKIPTLKTLHLRANKFSADAYKFLKNGHQIETCSVAGSKTFDDAAITTLSATMPNLRSFSCASTRVSDEGLKTLMSLKSLKQLTATKLNGSEPGISLLRAALPQCRIHS